MNISCPECETIFVIDEDVVITDSKKLKCSKCKHIWIYKNPDTEAKRIADLSSVNKIKSNLDLESSVKVVDGKTIHNFLYIYPATIAILIVIVTALIGMKGEIRSSGVSNTLVLKDIRLKNVWKEHKVVLNYRVYNNSDFVKNLPLIRIRLFDKDSKVLKMHIIKDKRELKPNQFVNINTEFESIMSEADHVDIALGNWLDFIIW